ncbi:transposable element Tcb1 transposase [Trichonephila clavipes]|nr:transposable element Tcb1 transposase [Trichonephila clavipes]
MNLAHEWSNVIFSDESRFCLQHQDGHIRVWRHRGERAMAACIRHRLTGPSLGVMQHNERRHVAGIVRTFLIMKNVQLLLWPARLPDLSPIENAWSMVAERLSHHHTPVTTVDELLYRVETAWSSVPIRFIQYLFESMARRISAVIIARGGCFWS